MNIERMAVALVGLIAAASLACDKRASALPASIDPGPGAVEAGPADTLRVQGRRLLDRCGASVVVRGVEQIIGRGMEVDGSWDALLDEIAATGANAVRILPDLGPGQLDLADVDRLLSRAIDRRMILYLSPYGTRDRDAFWGRAEVKAMVAKHQRWIVVDAFQEPSYDDRSRWRRDALAAIRRIRGQGYTVPITVLANQYGRDLPALLQHGAEIVAADPLRRTILGWQAYWGSSQYYQRRYRMTLAEGIAAAARQPFPIQIGLDHHTDAGGETADFASAISAAQRGGVGWLWWDYYNPFGRENNLSTDGRRAHLTPVGRVVVDAAGHGIAETSRRACVPASP